MRARYLQANKQPLTRKMYYVVANTFALTMQGYKATRSKNGYGCAYAIVTTKAQAIAHIKANKMRLYACAIKL